MAYWAAAQLQPRREKLAAHCLGLREFVTWFPQILERRRLRGRWYEVPRPLFTGYMFVLIEVQWHGAHYCPGINHLVMNGERPARVPDRVIEELRSRERNGVIELPEPPPRLRPGARVRVTGGPFRGHWGLAWISTDWNPSNAGFGKGFRRLRISALSVIRYGELITRVHAVSFASATILGELGTPRFRCIDLRRMPASWRSQVSWFNSRLTPDMANDTAHMCLSDHYMN